MATTVETKTMRPSEVLAWRRPLTRAPAGEEAQLCQQQQENNNKRIRSAPDGATVHRHQRRRRQRPTSSTLAPPPATATELEAKATAAMPDGFCAAPDELMAGRMPAAWGLAREKFVSSSCTRSCLAHKTATDITSGPRLAAACCCCCTDEAQVHHHEARKEGAGEKRWHQRRRRRRLLGVSSSSNLLLQSIWLVLSVALAGKFPRHLAPFLHLAAEPREAGSRGSLGNLSRLFVGVRFRELPARMSRASFTSRPGAA